MVLDTLLLVLKEVSLLRPMLPRLTRQLLSSLVLLMHHLQTILRLVDCLLDMSSCFMACLPTGKPLCFGQSLVQPLKQSCTLSQLLALNHNTGIAFATTLALPFILRRLSGVTIRRLYALPKVTLIAFKQSFALLISTKRGFARR
jgi:hypothetical protein